MLNILRLKLFGNKRFCPPAMFPDKIHQSIDSLRLRNVKLQRLLADIQIDLAGGSAHIAEVRIRHFAGPIHDATHYRDFYPFEVVCGGLDPSGAYVGPTILDEVVVCKSKSVRPQDGHAT